MQPGSPGKKISRRAYWGGHAGRKETVAERQRSATVAVSAAGSGRVV